MIPYNKRLVSNARALRRNMTKEEKHLWYDFLKKLPVSVYRQHNIENFIVDFYIAEKKLAIELDGSRHYDFPGKQSDAARDAFLAEQGLAVLRYANSDIGKNFQGVCEDILSHLE
jgi:very-short-patch-repair endonuclease